VVDLMQEGFLADLKSLGPDLCVTAAYGNYLPSRFLAIPPCGTVNVHPSLLPLYRGAAPVQRALLDGVKETGVSVAYTVRAMDSGPIIASGHMDVDPDIKVGKVVNFSSVTKTM
jgi:methionyl-tRNA formyltransferase